LPISHEWRHTHHQADLTNHLLLLFTMIDRHDRDSKWAPLWRSFPPAFNTGLTFPSDVVEVLEGTAAALDIARGQSNLRIQYAALTPLINVHGDLGFGDRLPLDDGIGFTCLLA
jgi:hypothetical protein